MVVIAIENQQKFFLIKLSAKLIIFCSKGEWFPLKREGPLPPHILRPSGTVKMLIHGYTINHKQTLYKKMEEQHLWDLGNGNTINDDLRDSTQRWCL